MAKLITASVNDGVFELVSSPVDVSLQRDLIKLTLKQSHLELNVLKGVFCRRLLAILLQILFLTSIIIPLELRFLGIELLAVVLEGKDAGARGGVGHEDLESVHVVN